jgi:hypothetical protein
MSNELDLVSDYMKTDDAQPTQLVKARSLLDGAIQIEILELSTDASPTEVARSRRRRSRVWSRLAVAGVAAVAACAVLIIQVVPTSTSRPPVAAAAQISRLADAVQPPPPLMPGQWSSVQMTGELLAQVESVGTTKTPDAQASIPISFGVWSNSTGTTCTSQQFGTATFASLANSQAWQSIGLIAIPTNQPATGCVAGVQAAIGGGTAMTPTDVANLTHDPVTLAKELQAGTTGIPLLGQSTRGTPGRQDVFGLLVTLIVGPTTARWPGYDQEMLETMALLPGVISLGEMTAHSGQRGLAFSTENEAVVDPKTGAVTSNVPSPTVLLDSATGALLEARNFSIPVLQSAARDFVGSPTAPVYTEGVSYGISTQWIDPVGASEVVPEASLPAWIAGFHVIEAVGNPNVDPQTMVNQLNRYVGTGNSLFSAPLPTPSQTTFDLTIPDTGTDVGTVVASLNASGLFQSVVIKA